MQRLTIDILKNEAVTFCEKQSLENHLNLLGITDGKAVGTYIECRLKRYLSSKYQTEIGNSAAGIDLPSTDINTDIKVTSLRQPQSSCPFKNAQQKIYGLGYNLLILVYDKEDSASECKLSFKHCTFIDADRTADYTTTARIIEMLKDKANIEDIHGFLSDKNIPGDDIVLAKLSEEIITCTPKQGFLTISNALQWRLQYSRAITLNNKISGIFNHDW